MSDNTRPSHPDGRQIDEGGRWIKREGTRSIPDYDPDQGRPLGEDDERTIHRDGEPLAEGMAERSPTPLSEGPAPPGEDLAQTPDTAPE